MGAKTKYLKFGECWSQMQSNDLENQTWGVIIQQYDAKEL